MVELKIKSTTFGHIKGYAVDRNKEIIYKNDCLIDKIIYPGSQVTLQLKEGNYEFTIKSNDLFTEERQKYELPDRINFND